MPKLITFSCFMLFWVFYEMSGGADFQPRERVVLSQAPFAKAPVSVASDQRQNTTPTVTNAAYVPVATQPLMPINAAVSAEIVVTAAPTPATTPAIEVAAPELRFVSGSRVNLRRGPGTNHQIIDTLPQGTSAELISMNDNGWAQIRLIDSDTTGWMASRLLSEG